MSLKHHIAVKFIAVFLAALALLGAVGSAAGIIGFTAADLYEQSVDDLYEDNMQSTRQNLAMHLVHQYASLKLGNLPENYFYNYWGNEWMYDNFQYGYYFYNILDENGKVVESTAEDMPEGTTLYTHVVTDVAYKHLFGIKTPQDDAVDYDIIENTDPTQESIPEVTIVMEDEFTLPMSTENTASAETDSDIIIAVAEPTTVFEEEIGSDGYYDSTLGEWVEFTYYYDELPPYTVELYLLPGAITVEPVWELVEDVWQYRYDLFYLLGFSLLIFAIMAVYLCCAAGKKPGREEIKAAGLNCIPLDLYLAGGCTAVFLILWLGLEVVQYLIRYSPDVLAPFILLAGFGCALIIVGFFFACAAQFKTPGGYWWRNSLVGHCCRLTVICWNWLVDVCIRIFKCMLPLFKKLLRSLWKLIRWGFDLVKKVCTACWLRIKRSTTWFGKKLSRFYSMLPLTWQWLLTGFIMIFLLGVTATSYSTGMVLFGVVLTLGIILYGTSAFGILLEGAKRMSKGDLETKVSDQFLIGSFKDFAKELNALADVAVVAAQKQMKSERMKTELITNVSHDIKTPLTSIINYVDLLQKPHTDEEQETYLEVLSRQSLQLKKLIEDLMEMSKASTGNLAVDITSVNAGEAINQALGEFADKLEKVQLIPVFRQPEEPIYMKADGRLVWRVMSNLLSNAVKYALPGTRLYIDLMELEGKVIISMKNISREELNVSADELLERFVRGDASRNTEGSGLGLNIAQSLMEIQKGQLQLLVDGDLFKVTLVFPAVKND